MVSASRVASMFLSASRVSIRDLPDHEGLLAGFERISKQWTSEWDAEAALDRLLERYGLAVNDTRSGGRAGPGVEWTRRTLRTESGDLVEEQLNVFHRPGMRDGWTAFQVSL